MPGREAPCVVDRYVLAQSRMHHEGRAADLGQQVLHVPLNRVPLEPDICVRPLGEIARDIAAKLRATTGSSKFEIASVLASIARSQ